MNSNDVIDIILNRKIILSACEKKLIYIGEDRYASDDEGFREELDNVYWSADEFSAAVKDILNESGAKQVRMLSLKSTGLSDSAFKEVTNALINFLDGRGIITLDLSFNALTPSIAAEIIRWIDDAGVKYINLDGNHQCSKKDIRNFCSALEREFNEDKQKVRNVMKHIIFIPIYYLFQASKVAKLYNNLITTGHLPMKWADFHREYYLMIFAGKCSFLEEPLAFDPDVDLV